MDGDTDCPPAMALRLAGCSQLGLVVGGGESRVAMGCSSECWRRYWWHRSCEPVLSGVLDLSSRRLLPELKAACERRLVGSLSMQSLADALVAAYLHDLAALKAACVEFIKANVTAVLMVQVLHEAQESPPRDLEAAAGCSGPARRSRRRGFRGGRGGGGGPAEKERPQRDLS